ncbi:MAG: hypothetical protein GY953_46695, partial [bacterium]|nr:hypothetical protein [bacterium]
MGKLILAIQRDWLFAFRALFKRPGASALLLITIALGIGVSAAIFSIVNAILIQPLPYRDPSTLVMLWYLNEKKGTLYVKDV